MIQNYKKIHPYLCIWHPYANVWYIMLYLTSIFYKRWHVCYFGTPFHSCRIHICTPNKPIYIHNMYKSVFLNTIALTKFKNVKTIFLKILSVLKSIAENIKYKSSICQLNHLFQRLYLSAKLWAKYSNEGD